MFEITFTVWCNLHYYITNIQICSVSICVSAGIFDCKYITYQLSLCVMALYCWTNLSSFMDLCIYAQHETCQDLLKSKLSSSIRVYDKRESEKLLYWGKSRKHEWNIFSTKLNLRSRENLFYPKIINFITRYRENMH